jgi:hypothetical protein
MARERLAKGALAAGSLLLSLALAEAAVRAFWHPPAPRRVVFQGESKPWCCPPEARIDGLLRLQPGAIYQHCYDRDPRGLFEADGCVTYRINSWGFRDVEHAVEKPPGVFRVVVLGDSYTVGEGTRFEEIYPRLLQEALGGAVEIINLAFPGQDTPGELQSWRVVGRRLAADLVVLQWNTNDFPVSAEARAEDFRLTRRNIELMKESAQPAWSALWRLVAETRERRQIAAGVQALTLGELQRGSGNLRQIAALRDAVVADGARFSVLLFPELVRLHDHPYAPILETMRAFLARERIPYVDLLPALATHRDRELWVHELDHHPNRVAHRIAFEQLRPMIEEAIKVR